MALSRLRLRLAGGFSLAFAIGLALIAAGALGYLWRESLRRLDDRLVGVGDNVVQAITRELRETPDSSFFYAASEVRKEWPRGGDGWVISDASGQVVVGSEDAETTRRIAGARANHPEARFDVKRHHPDLRVVAARPSTVTIGAHQWSFAVLAYGSTEGIEGDTELLATSLAIAAPLILVVSLLAGYLLAGRALRPVHELRRELSGIRPTDLGRRLPSGSAPDEVQELAQEFNALLERLDDAQQRNRGFVREAAHQIRTPLTLVLGEAAHELAAPQSTPERMRAALQRVRTAAEQMQRRVDELFLLAEAEAGVTIARDEVVELDGVVLECTDLMRSRAAALGCGLALGDVAPLVVQGHSSLLREAMLELIENGCRHGAAGGVVTVTVESVGNSAEVRVVNHVEGNRTSVAPGVEGSRGLGLPIVEWIAREHGGTFESLNTNGKYRATMRLPLRAAA